MTTTQPHEAAFRVLIVDDNEAIHDDLRKVLGGDSNVDSGLLDDEELLFDAKQVETTKFEIDSAYQGQEGLAMVERSVADGRPYAMAFVDVRMPPGWDGVETIIQLWKACPQLQVVICTAYSDYSWKDIVKRLGYSDSLVILKKPFDNIEVIQLAHALTQKWKMSLDAQSRREELERMVAQATEELTHHATHDVLTDLPNRRLLSDRLEQAIAFARRAGDKLAVLYIDLDGFKVVNDTLGHPVGDALLRQLVERMQDRLRESDTLARIGGDEFVLIASGLKDAQDARTLAGRLQERLRPPFKAEGHQMAITASVGISVYPEDGRDAGELLRAADIAMYEAKRRGKNRAVFFTAEIGRAANERLELETHLRSAIVTNQFVLYYQPEFELQTHRLVRFEALLRWNHPSMGLVSPGKFIPVAEDSGFVVDIGNWVIPTACHAARRWNQAGLPGVPVAVNISAQHLCRADFIATVMGALHRSGLAAEMLELELTESAIVHNFEEIAAKINRLRELGVRVSIDDFGTGYSSFSYLDKLPVAAIKIDRSFLQESDSASRSRSIVEGVVKLAHSLGLRVVVEGVETEGQLDFLRGSDADDVQGFLLGVPAPIEDHLPAAQVQETGQPEDKLVA